MKPITVLSLNDCFLINEGLRSLTSANEKMEFLHNIADESLLEHHLKKYQPSILILDPALTSFKRKESILSVQEAFPLIRFVFISQSYTPQHIKEFMSYGVNCFLLYNSDKKEILDAFISAHKSKSFFCSGILEAAIDSMAQVDQSIVNLSERELEVIHLMAQGLSSKEMRERLSVSIHTINSHKKNIFRKVHVNKASDLLLYALKNGLVEVGSA